MLRLPPGEIQPLILFHLTSQETFPMSINEQVHAAVLLPPATCGGPAGELACQLLSLLLFFQTHTSQNQPGFASYNLLPS